MIAAALAILGKLPWKWIGVALAVLAVLSGVSAWSRHSEAAKWKPRLEASAAALKTCQANRVTLEAAIASQNAAVALLAADTARRTAAGDKAAQQAHSAAQAASVKAGSIMAAKPGPDVCKAAFDLVRSSVQ